MRSSDAEADRRGFEAAGIGGFARFDFARKGRRPDGREVEVAFSLAFAASPALPETGFFVCQQHFPENFWSRAAQVHPNGALGVAGLTLVHERPEAVGGSLPPSSTRRRTPLGEGLAFAIDGGAVECLTPAGFAERYGARRRRTGTGGGADRGRRSGGLRPAAGREPRADARVATGWRSSTLGRRMGALLAFVDGRHCAIGLSRR